MRKAIFSVCLLALFFLPVQLSAASTLNEGDFVYFGKYDDDPILWYVFETKGDIAGLISYVPLWNSQYAPDRHVDQVDYASSIVAKSLIQFQSNERNFSATERQAMVGYAELPSAEDTYVGGGGTAYSWLSDEPHYVGGIIDGWFAPTENPGIHGVIISDICSVRPKIHVNIEAETFSNGFCVPKMEDVKLLSLDSHFQHEVRTTPLAFHMTHSNLVKKEKQKYSLILDFESKEFSYYFNFSFDEEDMEKDDVDFDLPGELLAGFPPGEYEITAKLCVEVDVSLQPSDSMSRYTVSPSQVISDYTLTETYSIYSSEHIFGSSTFAPNSELSVGSIVYYGLYKDSPILWRVIDISNDTAILSSEYVLWQSALHPNASAEEIPQLSINNAQAIKGLSDFLKIAFDVNEQNTILSVGLPPSNYGPAVEEVPRDFTTLYDDFCARNGPRDDRDREEAYMHFLDEYGSNEFYSWSYWISYEPVVRHSTWWGRIIGSNGEMGDIMVDQNQTSGRNFAIYNNLKGIKPVIAIDLAKVHVESGFLTSEPNDSQISTQLPNSEHDTKDAINLTINTFDVYRNNVKISSPPVSSQIINGRTMLPFRYLVEIVLGGEVDYDVDTQKITAEVQGQKIVMVVDQQTIYIDGEGYDYGQAPLIVDGSTLVPLRAFERVVSDLRWDAMTQTVTIIP